MTALPPFATRRPPCPAFATPRRTPPPPPRRPPPGAPHAPLSRPPAGRRPRRRRADRGGVTGPSRRRARTFPFVRRPRVALVVAGRGGGDSLGSVPRPPARPGPHPAA